MIQVVSSLFFFKIVPCKKAILINASDSSMTDRLLNRGKSSGRVDDNAESIKKRLEVFHQVTQPVIDHFEKEGKLECINSENTAEAAFAEIKKLLDNEEGIYDFDDGEFDSSHYKNCSRHFLNALNLR